MLFKKVSNLHRWRTRFAVFPTWVGTIGDERVTVWLGFYRWRFTEKKNSGTMWPSGKSYMKEYSLPEGPTPTGFQTVTISAPYYL